METDEVCGRPLDCFASPSKFIERYRNIFIVPYAALSTNKHETPKVAAPKVSKG